MRRRTSLSGDFSSKKRRTIFRSSSCSSLKPKFIAGPHLLWHIDRQGRDYSILTVQIFVPFWGRGQRGTGLVGRRGRGTPLRGGAGGEQCLRRSMSAHGRGDVARRRQRTRPITARRD